MANWISATMFAIEALGFVGVLFLLHRIIRTAKRRSEAINMADEKLSSSGWSNRKRQIGIVRRSAPIARTSSRSHGNGSRRKD